MPKPFCRLSVLWANRRQTSVNTTLDKVPVQTAQLGQAISGNSDKLLPAPPPLPWRTWLLWASLLTGVLVLGILAWRLQRQMRTGAD